MKRSISEWYQFYIRRTDKEWKVCLIVAGAEFLAIMAVVGVAIARGMIG